MFLHAGELTVKSHSWIWGASLKRGKGREDGRGKERDVGKHSSPTKKLMISVLISICRTFTSVEQHVIASWQITVDNIGYNYSLLMETDGLRNRSWTRPNSALDLERPSVLAVLGCTTTVRRNEYRRHIHYHKCVDLSSFFTTSAGRGGGFVVSRIRPRANQVKATKSSRHKLLIFNFCTESDYSKWPVKICLTWARHRLWEVVSFNVFLGRRKIENRHRLSSANEWLRQAKCYWRESASLRVQLVSSRDLLQLTRPLQTSNLSIQTPSPQSNCDVMSHPIYAACIQTTHTRASI